MSQSVFGFPRGQVLATLDRGALGAVLLAPLLLLHAHGIAEAAIAITGLSFLARSALTGDWAWLRTPWLTIGLTWWAWMLICSLPVPGLALGEGGGRSLVQAIAFVRFLIFAAAIEHAVLRTEAPRRWLHWLITAAAAYIAIQVVFQFITGYNFYGWRPFVDGELTGPFGTPRAGPAFAHLLLPALIPWAAARLARPGVKPALWAWGLLIGGPAIGLLIGQRMPFLLICLGLTVAGLLLPRLRWGLIAAGIAITAMLAASPVIAPRAHYRLVEKFSAQMTHFSASHYGKLYARALEIGVQNPVTGLGAEGYRTGCPNPRYFRPSFDNSDKDGGGAVICWNHPHNYYFEALVIGGVPGLILFAAFAIAAMMALGRGLARHPKPLRASLFAASLILFWPITSTTGFVSMPIAGWSFLILGWGLAEARWPNGPGTPI